MLTEIQRSPEQRYLLVALPEKSHEASRRIRGVRRGLRRAVVALLAITFIFFGGGIAATPQQTGTASALIDTDALCGYTQVFTSPLPAAWPGVSGLIADLSTPFAAVVDGGKRFNRWTQPYGNRPVTAEEWYGSAGLTWTTTNYKAIDGLCFGGLLRIPAGWFSSLIWGIVVLVGTLGLNIYDVATSVNVFDGLLDTVDDVIRTLASTLYLPFLMPIVMIGALWMGWQGLVKRRSSEAVQGAVWMVAATFAGFIFLGQPKFIATAINDVVTTVSTTIISTVAGAGTADRDKQVAPCSLPTEAEGGNVSTRVTKCALWYTFLFTPWAEGQFGEANGTLTVEGFYQRADGTQFTRFTSENMPSIGKGPNAKPLSGFAKAGQTGVPIEWLQLDARTFNHDEVICSVRNLPCAISRQDMMTAKTDVWWGITQRLAQSEDGFSGAKANLLDWEKKIPDDGSWSPPPGAFEWSGFRTEHRFLIALLALAAMIAGAAPVMFISLILVIQQIGFIFLLLFAPVFLLLGVHPGFGRRIAMNWIEQILSLSLKRIGNSLVLGILLAMVAAVLSSGGSWFAQVLLVIAVSATAIIFRKRIVDGISQVNLGGSGGDFGQQASSSVKRATSSTVSGAANTATQLAGGSGVGGLMGSLLGGAVVGAGGATLLNEARGGRNSRRIKKDSQQERTAYEEWYASSPVGQFEMEEYQKMEDENTMERERRAMGKFSGSPEEVEKWKEWATKYGKFDEFGRFIERPLPRPDDPRLAQILRNAGVTLYEDLEEEFSDLMEAAELYAQTNSEGVRFRSPVMRPTNPALENRLRAEGLSFYDDFERNAAEVKEWSIRYGTAGANGEVVPRAVPLPENPHLERVYFEAGITKFEDKDGNIIVLGADGQQEIIYPDQEIPVEPDPQPQPEPTRRGPQRPPQGDRDPNALF
jgi:hypothetical protein